MGDCDTEGEMTWMKSVSSRPEPQTQISAHQLPASLDLRTVKRRGYLVDYDESLWKFEQQIQKPW